MSKSWTSQEQVVKKIWTKSPEQVLNKSWKSYEVFLAKVMNKSWTICEKIMNTSLAAPWALAHRLQRRTACNTSPPALSKMADGVP